MHQNRYKFTHLGLKYEASIALGNIVIVKAIKDNILNYVFIPAARKWFINHQEEFNLCGLIQVEDI